MGSFIDLAGKTFSRLTVLGLGETRILPGGLRVIYWRCLCSCGKECVVAGLKLRHNQTRSCGCLQDETRGASSVTHGWSRGQSAGGGLPPEYRVWRSMRGRCLNQRNKKFPIYGGRGIVICERWESFENFRADMGERPSAQHSIDRINVNGNYEPDNCRWATQREQNRNRRTNRRVSFNGEALCIVEWAERIGIRSCVIQSRLDRGWDVKDALTKPPRPCRRRAA